MTVFDRKALHCPQNLTGNQAQKVVWSDAYPCLDKNSCNPDRWPETRTRTAATPAYWSAIYRYPNLFPFPFSLVKNPEVWGNYFYENITPLGYRLRIENRLQLPPDSTDE